MGQNSLGTTTKSSRTNRRKDFLDQESWLIDIAHFQTAASACRPKTLEYEDRADNQVCSALKTRSRNGHSDTLPVAFDSTDQYQNMYQNMYSNDPRRCLTTLAELPLSEVSDEWGLVVQKQQPSFEEDFS